MKSLLYILLFFVLGLPYSLRAASVAFSDSTRSATAAPADSVRKKHFRWSAQIMPFARTTQFAAEVGTINYDNFAGLSKYDGGIYFRPDLKYETNKFGIWAKPRLHVDFGGGALMQGENYDYRFFFQELKAKWQINDRLYLLGGRYFKQIGTSIFINPSNPFIVNTSRLNPKFELEPRDFVELNYSSNSSWNFSLLANVSDADSPSFNESFFKFRRSYGAMVQYYGAAENLGLLLTAGDNDRYSLGGFGQKNLNEALLVWFDGSLDYNIDRFYPVPGHRTQLLNYEMVNGELNKNVFLTGLVGASYTFSFGPTLQLEYLYNGKGYNGREFEMYNRMIESASDYNFDITRQLATLNLGRSINTGMPFIRKHYVLGQLLQNDVFGQVNYNFRYLYSFDDRSSQLSSLVEWDALDNLEVFTVALRNFGGRRTDLNRLLDYQVMFGLLIKL